MRAIIGVAFVLHAALSGAGAQMIPLGIVSRTPPPEAVDSGAALHHGVGIPWQVSGQAQRYAPVVSAVIPGGGQVLLGNDRFIGYVAVEALAWWRFAKNHREQSAQESEYKALARRVARAPFTSQSPDLLPDADWAYYEKMRDYPESGSFSLSLSGPIIPETDPATFNGSRWQLAQSTFATREAALQEYMRTAVTPDFEWSWKNARLQYDRFKRTTDKRNDAYRAGLTDLMVIGANHILSMVDAFSTVRLRARPDANGGSMIGVLVPW